MTPRLPGLFLSILLIFGFQSLIAQYDVTDRTLDLRNNMRILWQKSADESVAPNMVALPILDKKATSNIVLPFIEVAEQRFESTIILGDQAEVYLLFSDFALGPDQKLLVRSVDNRFAPQQFDARDNRDSRQFMIGPYQGDLLLEVNSPSSPKLSLYQVYANPVNTGAMDLGFSASYTCHTNVNCEEGSAFPDEKRSVMRIRMVAEEGVALCTGTLMNNTRGDRANLVLTAYHCLVPPSGAITPIYDMWWFDFNYESFSCANPEEDPGGFGVQGAELLARWEDTDMMLLRITDNIPAALNVYYAGWSRALDYEPDTTFLIHHPVGDIKKISWDFDKVLIHDKTIGWNNGGNSSASSHYINDFDDSTYQPGSSGASVMDTDGKVIGQLHGGPLSDEFCSIGIGYSGRLSISWNTGDGPEDRLKDWLDPLGTKPMSLKGINTKNSDFVRLAGRVITPDGLAIPDVRVSLTGDLDASFLTGIDGRFVFENLDPEGNYELSFDKNTNHGNGLSATDLVLIRNHIIGRRALQNEYQLLAADVSGDDNISSVDLVQVRNIIIGRQTEFPSNTSWDFLPATLEMNGANMGNGTEETTIIGIKLGDVNYSANPGK